MIPRFYNRVNLNDCNCSRCRISHTKSLRTLKGRTYKGIKFFYIVLFFVLSTLSIFTSLFNNFPTAVTMEIVSLSRDIFRTGSDRIKGYKKLTFSHKNLEFLMTDIKIHGAN